MTFHPWVREREADGLFPHDLSPTEAEGQYISIENGNTGIVAKGVKISTDQFFPQKN